MTSPKLEIRGHLGEFISLTKDLKFGVEARISTRDPETGEELVLHGRNWRIPKNATARELAETVRYAVMNALEHEAEESIFVDGVRVLDPHADRNRHLRPNVCSAMGWLPDEKWAAWVHSLLQTNEKLRAQLTELGEPVDN